MQVTAAYGSWKGDGPNLVESSSGAPPAWIWPKGFAVTPAEAAGVIADLLRTR